jgi:hypothetical protein
MCVWQGFIASAPGHPILADAIETVVNQVRNKFTSIDIDARFCPNPDISILHAFALLFTCGPCLLGGSINRALGRPGQMQFEPGEIPLSNVQPPVPVPGRTVILNQERLSRRDVRLNLVEMKMSVVAIDGFVGDDKKRNKKKPYTTGHSLKTFFGKEKVYANDHKANEDIRIIVP